MPDEQIVAPEADRRKRREEPAGEVPTGSRCYKCSSLAVAWTDGPVEVPVELVGTDEGQVPLGIMAACSRHQNAEITKRFGHPLAPYSVTQLEEGDPTDMDLGLFGTLPNGENVSLALLYADGYPQRPDGTFVTLSRPRFDVVGLARCLVRLLNEEADKNAEASS